MGSGKCPVGEMSVQGNVQSGKCPSGKFPVGEMSSAKCQSGNCPAGELSAYQYIELTFNSQGNLSCVKDNLCILMPMPIPDAHISIWPI